jgi:hypothetical protein
MCRARRCQTIKRISRPKLTNVSCVIRNVMMVKMRDGFD